MSQITPTTPPPLPESLRNKLTEFRRRLWSTKTMEVAFAAAFGLLASFLLVFVLDRLIETPGFVRLGLLVAGLVGGVVFLPVQIARWVGGHTSLLSVARRIAREDMASGDQLLSIVELTQDPEEFARSPELSVAAIEDGERNLRDRDLFHTLPKSRHRMWGTAAGISLAACAAGFILVPAAARNACARWLRPLAQIERYTFTRLAPHTDHLVVARFEAFELPLALAEDTRQSPELASLRLPGGTTLEATRTADGFNFEVPGLSEQVNGRLRVGDFRETLVIEPLDRPEISAVRAEIELPAYLELPEPIEKDVRGGTVGMVSGSSVALHATLTRELSSAQWSAAPARVEGDRLTTGAAVVQESTESQLTWHDIHGLSGTVPFQLGLRARADATPTVILDGLAPDMIVLHDQALAFGVNSTDDFGVRRVGLEWEGIGIPEGNYLSASGEKMLGVGDPDSTRLELTATLHPKNLGIDPQVLRLRAFALDALPGRERAYSAPITVQVMTEDDHMIHVTRALARWYDEAVEVRDTEHTLLKTNEELLAKSNEELDTPEARRDIQSQAAAERVNSRRLNRLLRSGSDLLSEAARNTQFNSNTLDDWAEMMAVLDNIADKRMPSVADLLAKAAEAEPSKGESESESAPQTGPNRDGRPSPGSNDSSETELPNAPAIADVESSFNDPVPSPEGEGEEGGKSPPANLTLPSTTVQGGGDPNLPDPEPSDAGPDESPSPTKEELAKALEEQRALMEEFQKVAGMISEILSNLEGSTFVKRLKALSRAETGVADDLDSTLVGTFGAEEVPASSDEVVKKVVRIQDSSSLRASEVREDLAAYVQRLEDTGKDTAKFQRVHSEMGDVGVTREMTAVEGLAAASRSGEAIAAAENLADNLDRWAELLIGPG